MTSDDPQFESFDKMAAATASALVQAAARYAFQLFRGQEFRRLGGFDRLTPVEQDRVFNELVAAYIVLIILVLEAPDLRIPREFRDYLADLKAKIPKAHLDYMESVGVGPEGLRGWEKLLSLRYDEYAKDRHEVRSAAMQIQSSEKILDLDELSRIQMLVPVQSVAIGCHHHVCRGETEGRDELFKRILGSLTKFYVDIRGRLEGGKTPPLLRARVALKRTIDRILTGKRRRGDK